MMDFNERVIPRESSNFMFKEALARYKFAANYVKANYRVLDLGCGTGYGENLLAGKGATVVGIDRSNEAIKFAKNKFGNKNITFKKGDVLKNQGKEMDVICSFEVIEHLKNPGLFLKNVYKSLKKGGVFIVSTPNATVSSPKGGVASPYHEHEYSMEEFTKLLKKEFRKVEVFGQTKSLKAKSAWKEFLKSQDARQSIVDNDTLGLRKLVPKSVKEKVWKILGNFAGRKKQEYLSESDFPITKKSVKMCGYFVAVCQKFQ